MAYTQPRAPVRIAPVSRRRQHHPDRLRSALSISIEPPPRATVSDRVYGAIVVALIVICLIGGAIAEAAR